MLLLIVTLLVNVAITFVGPLVIGQLSALVFALIVYILPLLLTVILIRQQKDRPSARRLAIISPLLGTLSYVGLSHFSLSSGAWSEFVAANSVANGSVTLNITSDPLSVTQLCFVVFIFFGAAVCSYMMSASQHRA